VGGSQALPSPSILLTMRPNYSTGELHAMWLSCAVLLCFVSGALVGSSGMGPGRRNGPGDKSRLVGVIKRRPTCLGFKGYPVLALHACPALNAA